MARRRRYNHKRRRGSLSFLYKLLAFVLICTAISLALTLFFRIRSIEVSGNDRYTRQEIIDAAGVNEGDNMFLMNKYSVDQDIRAALPYIEELRINRRLPERGNIGIFNRSYYEEVLVGRVHNLPVTQKLPPRCLTEDLWLSLIHI